MHFLLHDRHLVSKWSIFLLTNEDFLAKSALQSFHIKFNFSLTLLSGWGGVIKKKAPQNKGLNNRLNTAQESCKVVRAIVEFHSVSRF